MCIKCVSLVRGDIEEWVALHIQRKGRAVETALAKQAEELLLRRDIVLLG